jgi:thiol-disulfide isomerase/thioredoxin
MAMTFNQAFADLKVGDTAPKISPKQWLIGGSPKNKTKDRITVVFFCSSWNEASISLFPSLSKISKAYRKDVDVVAIDTWEAKTEDSKSEVNSMIQENRESISFSFAVDNEEADLAKYWIQAAGMIQLPALFVVDKRGKLAWFGYPQGNVSKVLDCLIANTYDYKSAQIECKRCVEIENSISKKTEQSNEFDAKVEELIGNKEYAAALALMDQQLKIQPERIREYEESKLWILLEMKSPDLIPFIKNTISDESYRDPERLNTFLWIALEIKRDLPKADYESIASISNDLLKMSPSNAMHLDTVALAKWRAGIKKEALDLQTKAVKIAEKAKHFDAVILSEMRARLKTFQTG